MLDALDGSAWVGAGACVACVVCVCAVCVGWDAGDAGICVSDRGICDCAGSYELLDVGAGDGGEVGNSETGGDRAPLLAVDLGSCSDFEPEANVALPECCCAGAPERASAVWSVAVDCSLVGFREWLGENVPSYVPLVVWSAMVGG